MRNILGENFWKKKHYNECVMFITYKYNNSSSYHAQCKSGVKNDRILCTYWLSGRAGQENIWLKVRTYDQVQQGLCAMTESQFFSRTPRPDSVNKHFIMTILKPFLLWFYKEVAWGPYGSHDKNNYYILDIGWSKSIQSTEALYNNLRQYQVAIVSERSTGVP